MLDIEQIDKILTHPIRKRIESILNETVGKENYTHSLIVEEPCGRGYLEGNSDFTIRIEQGHYSIVFDVRFKRSGCCT